MFSATQKSDLPSRQAIVESLFNVKEWANNGSAAFIECPGVALHTKPDGSRDCVVAIDLGRPPTVTCFHTSCADEVSGANYILRSAIGRAESSSSNRRAIAPLKQCQRAVASAEVRQQDVKEPFAPLPIPDPIPEPGETYLRALFEAGEHVSICVPDPKINGGRTYERNALIEMIARSGGVANLFTGASSVFVRVNPMTDQGASDSAVAQYRYCLLEIDADSDGNAISLELQFGAFVASGLPIRAVTFSGGRSLHAIVCIEANDAEEYRERTKEACTRMSQYIVPDIKCLNPSRYTRLPGARRLISPTNAKVEEWRDQTLLATHLGPSSWDDYKAAEAAAMCGERISFESLLSFDCANDPDSVLGDRWLCKGGTALFLGQSGVGKSMLNMQLCLAWASELAPLSFGIAAKRPLKILLVQAENDRGDLAEMLQGICKRVSNDFIKAISKRVIIYRDSSHTGADFLKSWESLVRLHKPDIGFVDPLLNYLGADINDQREASAFVSELSRVGQETGVITGLVHHFGKPKPLSAQTVVTDTDLAYQGLGSSVFVNWAREVVVLSRIKSDSDVPAFRLDCTKRRKRAGLRSMESEDAGKLTAGICIGHSPDVRKHGMIWGQRPFPKIEEEKKK